ncbi:transcriptional regulatory protein [Tolypocladium capitatum]|uniref:Transcriptional regulatory protein n=1 Tax=Tolypocladium capitatum TaxID=45235 RepID=A0A2K3QI41_9HYPO|nr:transcriptional regulatory protein [Tolypocladium capitatum]
MLQRVIAILRECKEVWPLAARWVEALEKFSLDPQSDTLTTEGSMDDGKDPVPRAIRQMPPLPLVPALPDNAVLPRPGTQPDMQPPTSMRSPHNAIMSPLPGSANGHALTPPNHQHQQQYQTPQLPQDLPQQAIFHQQRRQQAPQHMYMSPQQSHPTHGRQPVDGLGMLIEAFDTHQPAATPYGMGAPAAAPHFYPQLNDGFEGELQYYIDGAPSTWMNTGAWLDDM